MKRNKKNTTHNKGRKGRFKEGFTVGKGEPGEIVGWNWREMKRTRHTIKGEKSWIGYFDYSHEKRTRGG